MSRNRAVGDKSPHEKMLRCCKKHSCAAPLRKPLSELDLHEPSFPARGLEKSTGCTLQRGQDQGLDMKVGLPPAKCVKIYLAGRRRKEVRKPEHQSKHENGSKPIQVKKANPRMEEHPTTLVEKAIVKPIEQYILKLLDYEETIQRRWFDSAPALQCSKVEPMYGFCRQGAGTPVNDPPKKAVKMSTIEGRGLSHSLSQTVPNQIRQKFNKKTKSVSQMVRLADNMLDEVLEDLAAELKSWCSAVVDNLIMGEFADTP